MKAVILRSVLSDSSTTPALADQQQTEQMQRLNSTAYRCIAVILHIVKHIIFVTFYHYSGYDVTFQIRFSISNASVF